MLACYPTPWVAWLRVTRRGPSRVPSYRTRIPASGTCAASPILSFLRHILCIYRFCCIPRANPSLCGQTPNYDYNRPQAFFHLRPRGPQGRRHRAWSPRRGAAPPPRPAPAPRPSDYSKSKRPSFHAIGPPFQAPAPLTGTGTPYGLTATLDLAIGSQTPVVKSLRMGVRQD